jgi:hypothetical protein
MAAEFPKIAGHGRLKLKLLVPDGGILRDVRILPQAPPDFCIEEVRIGMKTVFRGTFPIEHLPRPDQDSLERKLYLSAIIPDGSVVCVLLRNLRGSAQYARVHVRVGSARDSSSKVLELS